MAARGTGRGAGRAKLSRAAKVRAAEVTKVKKKVCDSTTKPVHLPTEIFARWEEVKQHEKLESHGAIANFLLNLWENKHSSQQEETDVERPVPLLEAASQTTQTITGESAHLSAQPPVFQISSMSDSNVRTSAPPRCGNSPTIRGLPIAQPFRIQLDSTATIGTFLMVGCSLTPGALLIDFTQTNDAISSAQKTVQGPSTATNNISIKEEDRNSTQVSEPTVTRVPEPTVTRVPAHTVTRVSVNPVTRAIEHTVTQVPEHTVTRAPENPVTRAPVNPVTREPVNPVTRAPVNPVTQAPENPVTRAPVNPVTREPVNPVTRAPVNPVTREPVNPVTWAPENPVKREPVNTVTQAPVNPVTRAPVTREPVNPVTRAPENPVTREPVNPVTRVPVNSVTRAPKHPVTREPVNPVTRAPVNPVTRAPVNPVTQEPVNPVTRAPKNPVTRAPVNPVTRAPVNPVTRAPVNPVTREPVNPVTQAPKHPVKREPVNPVTQAPKHPVTREPVNPVTRAPVNPVTRAPVNPVTQEPVNPVTRAPKNPVTRAPVNPVKREPVNPVTQAPKHTVERAPEHSVTREPEHSVSPQVQVKVECDAANIQIEKVIDSWTPTLELDNCASPKNMDTNPPVTQQHDIIENHSTKHDTGGTETATPSIVMCCSETQTCPVLEDSDEEEDILDNYSPTCPRVKAFSVTDNHKETSSESEESDDSLSENWRKEPKVKWLDDEDKVLNDQKRRKSSRIRHKGFRPDYASLEITSESDNDVSDSKSSCDGPGHVGPGEDFVPEDDPVPKKKCKVDKQGITCDPELSLSESESSDGDSDGSWSGQDESDDLNDELKPASYKAKKRKLPKKKMVPVKLENHADKYEKLKVGSFEQRNRKSEVYEELFSCLVCNMFRSQNKMVFEEHIQEHVNRLLECSNCEYHAKHKFDLRIHKHGCIPSQMAKKLLCTICGFTCMTKASHYNHMGKKHGQFHWNCQYCDEKFTTNACRKSHMKELHINEGDYCKTCDEFYTSLSAVKFQKHMTRCTSQFPCEKCGKTFPKKAKLSNHWNRVHNNRRFYPCDLCPYMAKTRGQRSMHLMVHKGIHPYKCEQCTFTCVQRYQLTSHMRTHSGEKPYKCDQCNYAAAWNVQLKEHKAIHGLNTAVTCQQCGILLKNGKNLKMHLKKAH